MVLSTRGSTGRLGDGPHGVREVPARPSKGRGFGLRWPLGRGWRWWPGILVALCVGAPGAAHGQVNTETLRNDLKDRPRFLSVDGSFTGRMGNTTGLVVGVGLFGGLSWDRHLLFGKAQGDYARFGGATAVDKSFLHVRYNYRFTDRLAGELFGQIQRDEFQRLLYRSLYGIGPRFALVQTSDIEFTLGTSYMFEFERVSLGAGQAAQDITTGHRWNQYASFVWRVENTVRFSWIAYYQPRLDDLSDRRFLGEGSLKLDATARLSAKISTVIRYDSDPPPNIRSYDVELRNSLTVTF